MIVALFALSAAMVVGGIAAVIQGFPFVRLESGLAMVIAGATVASAGAVLAGLAVVATGLRRVAHAFDARRIVDAVATMQDDLRQDDLRHDDLRVPAPAAVPAVPSAIPVDPAPAAPPPAVRPVLPSFLVPGPDAGLLGGQSRTGPAFAEPGYAEPGYAEPVMSEPVVSEATADADPREPELPLPGLTPPKPTAKPTAEPAAEPRPADLPPVPAHAPEDDLFASPEAPASSEAPTLRPSLDAAQEPEPQAEPEPAPATREVVGRYASGGNTYIMFADGTIEAETPQGRYAFDSLDELKAFVEAGGETAARGAA